MFEVLFFNFTAIPGKSTVRTVRFFDFIGTEKMPNVPKNAVFWDLFFKVTQSCSHLSGATRMVKREGLPLICYLHVRYGKARNAQ